MMNSGDTLTIGDGTYAEQIVNMPSGIAATGRYTTIKATNDWGVTIDGSGLVNYYNDAIRISSKSWVTVRGFHVIMNQKNTRNQAVNVPNSDHIRVQRVSAGYGGSDDAITSIANQANVANIGAGPGSSYVLFEESFAYGGGRYNFIAYQSDHIVFRRNVSRIDHWNGSIQCAGFTNYNAVDTLWQNNIVIDSDGSSCYAQGYAGGRLFGGFFSENKVPDSSWSGTSTRETFRGNIVLNVQATYAGMYDYDISDVHTYTDNIIWNSRGGLYADYIHGDPAVLNASNMTIGGITGTLGTPGNGASALGVGYSVSNPAVANFMTNSLLWNNGAYGMVDFAQGNYNSYLGNGIASQGSSSNDSLGNPIKIPAAGANDIQGVGALSLKYLPRIETGSLLATAGPGGSQIGADVRYMQGATGTLWGEPGYDTKQATCLWPFPNETVIKAKMGAYVKQANTSIPGPIGARGFATGNSMDGSPQSLTKYIWEYLGNQIPAGTLCP